MNLVVVTLNDGNDFADHKKLFEYGFENYYRYRLLNKGDLSIHDKIYYGKYNLTINNDYDYTLQNNDRVYLNFELSEIPSEGKVGSAKVFINNKMIHEEDIYATRIEKKKSSSIWERLKKIW